MPKPSHHHEKMHKLVGRWRGTETMFPSQWDPEGGTANGLNDSRLALDGFGRSDAGAPRSSVSARANSVWATGVTWSISWSRAC